MKLETALDLGMLVMVIVLWGWIIARVIELLTA